MLIFAARVQTFVKNNSNIGHQHVLRRTWCGSAIAKNTALFSTFSSPTFAKNNLGLRFFNPSIWQKVGNFFTYEPLYTVITCFSKTQGTVGADGLSWGSKHPKTPGNHWNVWNIVKKRWKPVLNHWSHWIRFHRSFVRFSFLCRFMLQPDSALRLSPLFHISPWLRPCKKDRTKNKIDNIDDFRTFTWLILRGCRQV